MYLKNLENFNFLVAKNVYLGVCGLKFCFNPLTPAKKKVLEFADFLICYCPGLKKRLSKYENFDFKLFVQKIGTLIF